MERATTAAAVVVGAVAGLSVHNVEEGHHKVLAPRREFAALLPIRVLSPGWNLYLRLPGVHQVTLAPTGQTDHELTSLAKTSDDFAVMRTGRLVVVPDLTKLGELDSVALGGAELVDRAAQAAGRHALDEATAGSTARQLLSLSQAYEARGPEAAAQRSDPSGVLDSLERNCAELGLRVVSYTPDRCDFEARFHSELARPRRPMGLGGGGGSCSVM